MAAIAVAAKTASKRITRYSRVGISEKVTWVWAHLLRPSFFGTGMPHSAVIGALVSIRKILL